MIFITVELFAYEVGYHLFGTFPQPFGKESPDSLGLLDGGWMGSCPAEEHLHYFSLLLKHHTDQYSSGVG